MPNAAPLDDATMAKINALKPTDNPIATATPEQKYGAGSGNPFFASRTRSIASADSAITPPNYGALSYDKTNTNPLAQGYQSPMSIDKPNYGSLDKRLSPIDTSFKNPS
jgi:hypothetical protein